MAWRVVKQPNGLYARWSDVVDNFTVWNATAEEITQEIISDAVEDAKRLAEQKLKAANEDQTVGGIGRWKESLAIMSNVHGEKERIKFMKEYEEANGTDELHEQKKIS